MNGAKFTLKIKLSPDSSLIMGHNKADKWKWPDCSNLFFTALSAAGGLFVSPRLGINFTIDLRSPWPFSLSSLEALHSSFIFFFSISETSNHQLAPEVCINVWSGTRSQTSPLPLHALLKIQRGEARIRWVHSSSLSGLLMTPSMIHHSCRGWVEMVPKFDSNDVKLLIYPFVNKVNIMFGPVFQSGA